MENLYKVGGSMQRIQTVKAFLWKGKVDSGDRLFELAASSNKLRISVFTLRNIDTVSSITNITKPSKFALLARRAIESTVKQIDRRTKISGAQGKIENVPQVIAHRCAYLNGLILLTK